MEVSAARSSRFLGNRRKEQGRRSPIGEVDFIKASNVSVDEKFSSICALIRMVRSACARCAFVKAIHFHGGRHFSLTT